jgi:hypothetical protein
MAYNFAANLKNVKKKAEPGEAYLNLKVTLSRGLADNPTGALPAQR